MNTYDLVSYNILGRLSVSGMWDCTINKQNSYSDPFQLFYHA